MFRFGEIPRHLEGNASVNFVKYLDIWKDLAGNTSVNFVKYLDSWKDLEGFRRIWKVMHQ